MIVAAPVEPLVDAFLALLRAGSPPLRVHDSQVPGVSPVLPYVVTYADNGIASTDRLVARSNLRDVTVQTTSVASTATAVRAIRDLVAAQLLDQTLVVAGWRCWPIRQLASRAVARDDDVTPSVLFGVDEWGWRCAPASA